MNSSSHLEDMAPELSQLLSHVGSAALVAALNDSSELVVRAFNDRASDLLTIQLSPDEPLHRLVDSGLADNLRGQVEKSFLYRQNQEVELPWKSPSGNRSLRVLVSPLLEYPAEERKALLTFTDVTQIHEAATRNLQSELKFMGLVEGSVQGIVVTREDRALFCNPALARILGFLDVGEIYALPNVSALVHPEDRERVVAGYNGIMAGRIAPRTGTFRCVRKDGTTIWIEAYPSTTHWEGDRALQLTVHDVTGMKHAQQALRESEARYRTLVEGSLQAVVVNVGGKPVFVNQTAADMLGYADAEEELRQTRDMVLPHVSQSFRERALDLLRQFEAGIIAEHRGEGQLVRKDGSLIEILLHVRRIEWNGAAAILIMALDITALKQRERELNQSRTLLASVIDNIPLAVLVKDLEGRRVVVNRATAASHGAAPQDLIGTVAHEDLPQEVVPDSERDVILRTDAQVRQGQSVEFEMDRRLVTGLRRYRVIKVPIQNAEGQVLLILSIAEDITERKRVEAELSHSRALLQTVFDSAPIWLWMKDREGRYLIVNREMSRDTGIAPDQHGHITARDVPWREDQQVRIAETDRRVIEEGVRLEITDSHMYLLNGEERIKNLIKCPLMDEQGAMTGLVGVGVDVTELKHAEDTLRTSEQRYRALVEGSIQGIAIIRDRKLLFVNQAYARMHGFATPDEVLALGSIDPLLAPEDRGRLSEYERLRMQGKPAPARYEFHGMRKNGGSLWIDNVVTLVEWEGRPAVLATLSDITQRKEAEQRLTRSEERYRSLVEHSLQAMAVFSPRDGRALFANPAMLQLTGDSDMRDYLAKVRLFDRLRDPYLSKLRQSVRKLARGELTEVRDELQAMRDDGSLYWAEFIASRVDWDGEPAVQLSVLDVTARKREQEALQESQALLTTQNEYLRKDLNRRREQSHEGIIAVAPSMQNVLHEAEMVARSQLPVLIEGETGSGKEVVADFIHRKSDRAAHVLSVVNCGALTETLMDAELFGFERGAFTGATEARAGLIEIADGGTLFLDEIGDLPPNAQVRLLRFLERGVVRRLGSNKEKKVDVRILAATHKTLKKQVEEETFREDLYHRLMVIRIEVPPLRERIQDILPLALHMLEKACREAHVDVKEISPEARLALTRYEWPGNVRELLHAVQRAVFAAQLEDSTTIRPEHLDLPVETSPQSALMPIKPYLRLAEQRHVREVLRHFQGNRRQAAKTLGISERHLYRLLG